MSREVMQMALNALEIYGAQAPAVNDTIEALHACLAQPEPDCYGYAKRLAEQLFEKHYKKIAPEWKPLDSTLGVLTQIDNMTCRLVKAQPKQYDQTELELCKKCGWKAVWPDGCLVCEKQKVKLEKEFNPASEKMVCVKEDHKLPKNIPIVNLLHDEIMYAAPHKKEWVGLTEKDIVDCFDLMPPKFARAIEAKLKEKNT